MRRLPFSLERSITLPAADQAYLSDGQDPVEGLIEAVVQAISTDLFVRVGDVRMHLAAWEDPDHWEDDWQQEHGLSPEEVYHLVSAAVTDEVVT